MLAPPVLHRPVLEPHLPTSEPHIPGAAKEIEESAVLENLGAGERTRHADKLLVEPGAADPGLDPGGSAGSVVM
jgi:hypothetical protein